MNRKLKISELDRLTEAEYKDAEKTPMVIVLENIRSLNNVGAIFRTADAFRAEGVYLTGYTPQPPHREIQKTALGATKSVPWKHFQEAGEAIQALKDEGYLIASVEHAEKTKPLNQFKLEEGQKVALILGNEVEGVTQESVDASDVCLEVPQYGTKHSLNVSVCAGVVMWEIAREQRG